MKLYIPASLLKYFMMHVSRSRIEECGILVGDVKNDVYMVKALFIGINTESSPVRFSIDPLTIISAHDYADRYGYEVLSVIHSHPAPPHPSEVDRRGMSTWRVPWVIVDSNSLNVGVWIYREGDVYPVEYNII